MTVLLYRKKPKPEGRRRSLFVIVTVITVLIYRKKKPKPKRRPKPEGRRRRRSQPQLSILCGNLASVRKCCTNLFSLNFLHCMHNCGFVDPEQSLRF
jgi:hypothetical protein